MDAPGIERTRLDLLSSHDIHSVYWDDVRVPAANLVGGENGAGSSSSTSSTTSG